MNKLKMERSGKRVETEVVDEDASGMSSSVTFCQYMNVDTLTVSHYAANLLKYSLGQKLSVFTARC